MKKRKILTVSVFIIFNLCWYSSIGQFQTTASFPNARYAHCTAQSSNNNILIFGGTIATGANINSVYEYNPSLNTWTAKASIPNAAGLSNSTCVKLNNGNVILFGGCQNGSNSQSNKIFQYNTTTDTWSILSDLPNSLGRERMRSTLINNSTVLLTGGLSASSGALNYLTTSYLYNVNTNTFTLAGNLPIGLINHTSTLLPNGEVLITGGFDGYAARNEAYIFNLQNGWRTVTSTLSLAVSAHSALLLNGKVYIYGGFSIPLFQFSNKLDVYDPTIDAIIPVNTGPIACSEFAMVPYNSSILIAGGNKILPNFTAGVTNESYLYNINNNTFSTFSNLPSSRSGMEITELGNSGKFIFSGGHIELTAPFNDAIIYDATLSTNQNNLLHQIQFYPNPAPSGSYVSISLEKMPNKVIKAELLSVDGKLTSLLFNSNLAQASESPFQFKLPNVASGNYIIQFTGENGQIFTNKIIITN